MSIKKLQLLFISSVLFTTHLKAQSESHLRNLKQLTFGGDNAEAYFSFDDKNLSFINNS